MRALTREWMKKAERDRLAANELLDKRPRVYDIVCFHCQQGVEKFLKALLVELGQSVPKTHDLLNLVGLIANSDPTVSPLRRLVSNLTEFAVEYRYPGMNATRRQAVSCLEKLERTRHEVRKRLGLRPRL